MLNFKVAFYEEGEHKHELSKWDTEAIHIYPVERCPKPVTRMEYVACYAEVNRGKSWKTQKKELSD